MFCLFSSMFVYEVVCLEHVRLCMSVYSKYVFMECMCECGMYVSVVLKYGCIHIRMLVVRKYACTEEYTFMYVVCIHYIYLFNCV